MKKDPAELTELETRAHWLAWRYEIDEKRVLNALKRLEVKIESVIEVDLFAYLQFDPSLEEALFYLRPEAALKLYETADLEDIRRWLELTQSLLGRHVHDRPWVEELCRWNAEQHLLPDAFIGVG